MPATNASIARSRRSISSRRAARHSTGPRTDAGKSTARFNALTHGVYAREAVLPTESAADYDALFQAFIADCRPVGHAELAAVSQMADASWRLRRVNALEASLFSDIPADQSPTAALLENPRFRLFAELGKQYGRYDRAFHAARKALAELQQERRKIEALQAQRQSIESLPHDRASFAPPAPNTPSPSQTLIPPCPDARAATIQGL